MVKVKTEKLQPGMVLAQDLFGANGISLKTGTILTNRFIGLIGNKRLFTMDDFPVTDESYNILFPRFTDEIKQESSAVGQTIGEMVPPEEIYKKFGIMKIKDDLFAVNENLTSCPMQLNIPGTLNVNGSILSCASLFVSGTVFVRGDIRDSSITAKKDVQVLGDVRCEGSPLSINSFGTFSATSVSNARINASHITIQRAIVNSELKADTSIEGPYADRVRDSQLQAGFNIVLGSVHEKTTLVIFSEKQVDLVRKLMAIEKKIVDFDKEMEPLKQTIKVYQLLKDRLQDLPDDKREKLLSSLRLVKTKLEKKKFLDEQFTTLKTESDSIRKSRETKPIVINDLVSKGTKVHIDNHSFVVQLDEKGVVFYKKSFIIMGKKDKEWGTLG